MSLLSAAANGPSWNGSAYFSALMDMSDEEAFGGGLREGFTLCHHDNSATVPMMVPFKCGASHF